MLLKTKKRIIGRRELIDLPTLELFGVEAKIDTGAFTSAIHCSDIREAILPDGTPVIRFNLLDPSHPKYHHKIFEFTQFSLRDIKNSFGDVQERYVIRTQIRLFNKLWEADFSLSDRKDMKYPILIGRAVLQKNFIVDVARKNVSAKAKK
ncbi:ATP-dependent zinc protease family protein [Adhaeribacter radiodurans]|uniref:ATP-dependent zinc protease n=1 Tax=Adhaeribacter radiodurans TaxID=2745197 RepID=A0A7L7L495_9BACT|nr:RimK/LysX family protein [Adhaeribacter radiodurans]QMU27616.1 ATP-dependent zinc protease [Adhaeribacter radiodurans]